MRTDELALDYIDRAELTLEEARNAFEKEVYSLAIRRAQETPKIFGRDEGLRAIKEAEEIMKLCWRLIKAE